MNITEFMSFDLDWFTTLPGILITSGVVVLLIALIIFIASNKKEKKNTPTVDANVVQQPTVDNQMNMPVADMGAVPNTPIENNMNFGFQNPVVGNAANPMNINNTEVAIPMVNDINQAQPTTNMDHVPTYGGSSTPTNVVDFSTSTLNQPAIEINPAPVEPVVSNVVEPTIPVMDQTVPASSNDKLENSIPIVENNVNMPQPNLTYDIPTSVDNHVPIQETVRPTIYGGVDPTNTIVKPAAVKPVIYGGANPLENTTTIPRINHEAYNMGGYTANNHVTEEAVHPIDPTSVEPTPVNPTPINPTVSEPVQPMVEQPSVTSQASVPIQEPVQTPVMPMTGAEMFGATNSVNDTTSSSSDEIETLEF